MADPEKSRAGLPVCDFIAAHAEALQLERLDHEGDCSRLIVETAVHRPGLALAGFVEHFTSQRIQLCGNTESEYLQQLDEATLRATLGKVFSFNMPCIIFANNNHPSPVCIELAEQYNICLFKTPIPTTQAIQLISGVLHEFFAPRTHLHGTLVDVYGIGILLTGRSGIGKTEVALDLVKRGHRLVADDVVTVIKRAGGILIGSGNRRLRHNMEIRGVGIIDVQAVFGIRGIRMKKRIEALVELKDWDESHRVERTGLEESMCEILGESIPKLELAMYPGKSIAVIVEVIALNHLLKLYGHHPARELEKHLARVKSIDMIDFPAGDQDFE
ncbi:HPr(Ser) kinase/phosphatase [bacterium]|nr:HPr(Ser) kinase/phosphatase [bacterium]